MIKYIKGDLFAHIPTDKNILIAHVVNNIKLFGAGFVVPLGQNFPMVKQSYLDWDSIKLGSVQFVSASQNIIVANMCAQNGVGFSNGVAPLRYAKLFQCLEIVVKFCEVHKDYSIMAPKFGSKLAGGNWGKIENMIKESWRDIEVTIYEL